MQLELEDYRHDAANVPSAISRREGVLLSILFHALLVIAYLVVPRIMPSESGVVAPVPAREDVRYVQILPRVEQPARPRPEAEQSDLDRRAASPEAAPVPENVQPLSRGDTPEKIVGAPVEKPSGPDPNAGAPPTGTATSDIAAKVTPEAAPVSRPNGGGLGASLRNLQQFLQDQHYDNPRGGQASQNADIQFDSKGVEFGPWLRRFVAQVKRNWYVPLMPLRGRVVIQFYVNKNGSISELKVVQPSTVESFTTAAFNALKLSNPTLALPPEYPDERAFFTVTFHYNEGIDR